MKLQAVCPTCGADPRDADGDLLRDATPTPCPACHRLLDDGPTRAHCSACGVWAPLDWFLPKAPMLCPACGQPAESPSGDRTFTYHAPRPDLPGYRVWTGYTKCYSCGAEVDDRAIFRGPDPLPEEANPMTITTETLSALSACQEGIATFQAVYPSGLNLADWTPNEQLRVLATPLRAYLGWAWHHSVIPAWSLAEADLAGAYLAEADLAGANLAGADLTGAYLAGANLTGADLGGAYLGGADLTGANLARANLTGAYLGGADLTRANLTCADLADTQEAPK